MSGITEKWIDDDDDEERECEILLQINNTSKYLVRCKHLCLHFVSFKVQPTN